MQSSGTEARVISLDAMRGFAVMGILAINIIGFSMPEWAYVTPSAYAGETMADQIAWFFSFVFIEGKIRGLFSLLFGASMMLIIEHADAKGESAAKVHYSRMLWLGLFGLVHYFFIWFGDILVTYATIACVAFLFRNWQPERLIKWAFIIFALGLLLWGVQFGGLQILQYMATMPGADVDSVKQYREIMESPDFDVNVAKDLALHRGAYWPIVTEKFGEWYSPFAYAAQSLGETLPLMMIGMAMKKNGFLTGQWALADYKGWALKLVPAGLLLSTLLAAGVAASNYDLITSLSVFLVWNGIPRLMLTIGYAALLLILIAALGNSGFIMRVAAAGRVAFTNYLCTSIVMTTIFYGYGIGMFGYVSRPELWLFVIGAWAVMLLWSKPWLLRFRYGPLEWLWRSLARMKLQPFRR